jgi:hypothetical protein
MFSKLSIDRDVADIQAWLTAADPADGPLGDSTATRLAALRHRIEFDGLRAGSRSRRAWWPNRPGRPRRRKIVIACVAVPALTAATAAGWVIAANTPGSYVAQNVWCLPSAHAVAGDGVELPTSEQDPVAACGQMWVQGQVSPGVHQAPPLVACSLGSFDGGSIGVYPDTTCQAEHLQPVPAGYRQAAQNMAALNSALEADGLSGSGLDTHRVNRCYSAAAATALVRQALQGNGLTGWQIVVQPFSPGWHCADAAPDSATHTVIIVGVP